jgi:LacI family transcriptional regulator
MMTPKQVQQPTIMDVAARAGVSTATVSRAINQSGPVRPGTSEAVWKAIRELDYQPNVAARGLASRRTHTIGLLLPGIGGEFFAALLRGIEHSLVESRYNLLVHSTFPQNYTATPFTRALGEHNSDGLLVFTGSLQDHELHRLSKSGLPMILLYCSSPPGLKIPSVVVENRKGTVQLITHLIQVHNRKRIVFLRGPDNHEDSTERETGYWEALALNGIKPDTDLIGHGDFSSSEASKAIHNMMDRGIVFDAVFAADDEAASGVLQALHQRCVPVPDKVSVVGFDNSSLASHLTPPLTTVDARIEQTGYVAVTKLIELIELGTTSPVSILPSHLVIRRSCGCEAAPDSGD